MTKRVVYNILSGAALVLFALIARIPFLADGISNPVRLTAPRGELLPVSNRTPEPSWRVAPVTVPAVGGERVTENNPLAETRVPAGNPSAYADPTAFNEQTRAAVVNVFCSYANDPASVVASGSGVFIDSRGIILTNAHVAQYFLLDTYKERPFVDCLIRVGSPARNRYRARLLYLPPAWIRANARFITDENVTSLGADDFALLAITETINGDRLPTAFPFVTPQVNFSFDEGVSALAVAYPAGFIGDATILRDLYLTSAPVILRALYSFNDPPSATDVIGIGGSIVAQKGASGGAVVEGENGGLIGIIVTSSMSGQTADRNLNALTSGYINRELKKERGDSLAALLDHSVAELVAMFDSDYATTFKQLLITELEK